jgi:hypothetical protein
MLININNNTKLNCFHTILCYIKWFINLLIAVCLTSKPIAIPCLSEIHLQPHQAEAIHVWVRYTYSHTQQKLSISKWDTLTATPNWSYSCLNEVHLQSHPAEAIHVRVRYTYSHTQQKLSIFEWDTLTAKSIDTKK